MGACVCMHVCVELSSGVLAGYRPAIYAIIIVWDSEIHANS